MARFTASISDEVKERLDAFAEENGYNRSEALEMVLRSFFSEGAEVPVEEEPEEAAPVEREEPERSGDLEEVWAFLGRQHEYLRQLHQVVVDNAEASTSLASFYKPDLDFFVPDSKPPAP